MEKINFEEKLEKAKAKLYDNDKLIKNKIKNLERFIEYINSVIQNENLCGEELKEKMHEEYNTMLYEYLQISGTSIAQKQVQALKTINNNQYILDTIYNKIKDKDLDGINFEERLRNLNGTEEEFEINEVASELQWLRKELECISPSIMEEYKKNMSDKNHEKRRAYQEKLKRIFKGKKAIEYLDIFMTDSEKERLQRGLKYRENEIEIFMLENQKKQYKKAGEFLGKYELLEFYTEMQNKDYQILEIPEMQYSVDQVKEIFDDKYIDSLKPIQLAILNGFWQNRFTKEAMDFGEVLFIIDTLNGWDNLPQLDLSEEEMKIVLQKELVCDYLFDEIKDDMMNKRIKEKTFEYGIINLNELPEKVKEQYNNYFNKMLPKSKNELIDDVSYGQNKRNVESVIYRSKNSMIQELLLDIEHNSNITNWGYVPEKSFGKNTIQRHKKHILISVDYPGFNMPLRLHADRELVLNLIKTRKNNTVIPMYEGEKDFEYRGRILTTKIFMPLTEEGESAIIKENKNLKATDSRYSYIKHMGNLVTKKVKSIKKIYPSRYVDLESGIEGTKTRENKFIPDSPIDENQKLR